MMVALVPRLRQKLTRWVRSGVARVYRVAAGLREQQYLQYDSRTNCTLSYVISVYNYLAYNVSSVFTR